MILFKLLWWRSAAIWTTVLKTSFKLFSEKLSEDTIWGLPEAWLFGTFFLRLLRICIQREYQAGRADPDVNQRVEMKLVFIREVEHERKAQKFCKVLKKGKIKWTSIKGDKYQYAKMNQKMTCEILWMSKWILKQSNVKRISIGWQHFRSLCSDHQWKASLSALWLLRPLEEF